MLYWKSNFQIPDSGIQSLEVYAFPENSNNNVSVKFYSDINKNIFLFEKDFILEKFEETLELSLKTQEYFNNYQII